MLGKTLYGVVVLSVCGGLLLQIFPKTGRMVPYVRFLLALTLLLALLSPLISMLSQLAISDITALLPQSDAVSAYDGYWSYAVIDAARERMEDALRSLICAEFGLDKQDIDIMLTTACEDGEGEEAVTVTAVCVVLYRRSHRIAADKIAARVEQTMLCPCTVVLSEEEHA